MLDSLYMAIRFISFTCLMSMAAVVGLAIYRSKKYGIPLFKPPSMSSHFQMEDYMQYRPTSPQMDAKDWLILVGTILWVLCPLDGDFIPFLGWVDDLAVIGYAFKHFHSKFWANKEPQELPPEAPQPRRAVVHQYDEDHDAIDAEFEVRNVPAVRQTRVVEVRRRA